VKSILDYVVNMSSVKPLHQRERSDLSKSDEWETNQELCNYLVEKYNFNPELDVCATRENKKCKMWIDKNDNALGSQWYSPSKKCWCNPPHSLTEEFVREASKNFIERGIETMMIIPANSICTKYAENFIWSHAEFYPIPRSLCYFLKDGEKLDHSRNGYFVVIWRKR
jgi:site-specific DNA-methyltransferase (adenine-specific)